MNEDKHYFIIHESPIDENINKNSTKVVEKYTDNKSGKTVIEAILQDVDNKNRNGRVYEKNKMSNIINCSRFKEQLQYRGLKGEAGHPASKDSNRQATVDPKLVSHRIIELWMEGNYVKGKVEASGPFGQYFEEDIRDGEYPAFSFRGIGSIENINGVPHANIAVPVTWDRVYYPSHKVAYMTKQLNENVNELDNNNSNILIMTESNYIPIESDNEALNKFIHDESKRLRRLSEVFNMEINKIEYNKFTNTVTIKNNDKKILFPLEEYVSNQIKTYIL